MSLPFSTSPIQIGNPASINKVVGNGLIPFLGEDGNLYLVDVRGNVSLFASILNAGSILYDVAFVATAGQSQFPSVPDTTLNKCNKTMLFQEGTLLTVGGGSDEYTENFLGGFVTTNYVPGADIRMRLIGYNV